MAIDSKIIEGVASRLRGAAESGAPIAPIRDELAAGGVQAAYAVQNANTEHALKQGRRLVGRKIGLTSKSVQKQLGVDSPDFGMLFADMAFNDNEEVALEQGDAAQGRGGSRVRARARSHARAGHAAGPHLRRGVRAAGDRDRRQPHREVGHQAPRHRRRQRLGGPVRARRRAAQARRARPAPVRHGDGAAGRGGVGGRRRGVPRPSAECGAVARPHDGRGRPAAQGRRRHHERCAGADGRRVAPGDVIDTRINGLGSVRAAFAA